MAEQIGTRPLTVLLRGGQAQPDIRRAGVWLVASLTFAPLFAACVVAYFVGAAPLVDSDRAGPLFLYSVVAGWLAFVACGFATVPRGFVRRIGFGVVFGVLSVVAVYSLGAAAFILGRLEAHSPPAVMVVVAAFSVAFFALGAAGIPRLHGGVDTGTGLRTLPYLGVFGAVAVPILSDERDFLADKVDGWTGIGVLAVIAVVLVATAAALVNIVNYIATARPQTHASAVARLAVWFAIPFAAAMALALVFRR